MNSKRSNFPCPQVARSFDGFRSPIDEKTYIRSRKEHERDMIRHDCVPAMDVQPHANKTFERRRNAGS